MSKLFIIVLALCFQLLSCTSGAIQRQADNIDIVSDDEYEVYSFIINYAEMEKCEWGYKQPIFMIRELTRNHFGTAYEAAFVAQGKGREKSLIRNLADLKMDISIIDDFKKKDKKEYKLENKFNLPNKFVVEPAQVTREAGFFIEVSRVGFNADHSQALVCYGRRVRYAYGCGDGVYFLLAKENNKWVIKRKIISWAS